MQDEQHAVLADGEQQLLVRYERVIPSRNSSDNDRQVRPRCTFAMRPARGQSVRLQAPCLRTRPMNAARVSLSGSVAGTALEVRARIRWWCRGWIAWTGMPGWMEYNRRGGSPLAGAADVALAAVATPRASPASALEGRLQQLFLQARPRASQARFIGCRAAPLSLLPLHVGTSLPDVPMLSGDPMFECTPALWRIPEYGDLPCTRVLLAKDSQYPLADSGCPGSPTCGDPSSGPRAATAVDTGPSPP